MTSSQIQDLLTEIQDGIQVGIDKFPKEFVSKIIGFTDSLKDEHYEIIEKLTGVTKDDITKIMNVVKSANSFFTEGKAEEVSTFAASFKNRKIIIKLLSWIL